MLKKSSYLLRVYYEDTDLAGIVYYANYLKFIERARSEMLKKANVNQMDLIKRGYFFVVTSLKADYLKPAYFEDSLKVITEVAKIKGASIILQQTIFRSEKVLFEASIRLALIDKSGKVARLPANIRQLLGS
ncbi:tol-pal system-associated acyl-CoA thioesterase [Rhodobacteraceae bacterium]|nr:tol-pal system-associated acyl-CoA thioesterase [Paracoccaceae bacterium]MDC1254867.1 tol-pal system-associated acyl-CoA thioesterase [Paracoccaceae bacterium]